MTLPTKKCVNIPQGKLLLPLTLALLCAGSHYAYAHPDGGVVTSGQADITYSGTTTTIHQTTDKAIIDWLGFDIGAGETTRFNQPTSSSLTLNRVNGNSASHIDGNLTANGNIIIINQNGVLFGGGARVDVNGLVVSTADIRNEDFNAGHMRFDIAGKPDATIENKGRITAAQAGLVGLVAPNVVNSGVIEARLGRVQLSSGDSMTLDLYGDQLMEVKISDQVQTQLVRNSGVIAADGGSILLTAAAARDAVDSLIENTGTLRANAVGVRSGSIRLYAEGSNAVIDNDATKKHIRSGSSHVINSGTIEAKGVSAGEQGGTVQLLADKVTVEGVIDASGDAGGGIIRIGGDFRGEGKTPTALVTVIADRAYIKANSYNTGDGGRVSVWADDRTTFGGSIEANALGDAGDGGTIETSGKVALMVRGSAFAYARRGRNGNWLLDPADVNIDSTYAANIKSSLDLGTDVTVDTSGVGGSGDITVSSAISTVGSGSLTLSAYRNITVNATITLLDGNLTLRANNAGAANGSTGAGAVIVAGALGTSGGDILIGGGSGAITAGSGYAVAGSTRAIGVDITANINAGGGALIINGMGNQARTSNSNHGISVSNAAVVRSNGGTIDITGKGGGAASTSNNYGIQLVGAGSEIAASGAAIANISGYGGTVATGNSNYGVRIDTDAIITASGAGTLLTVTGTGGGAGISASNFGVNILGANSKIAATDGANTTIIGYGGTASTGNSNYGIRLNGEGSITADGAGTVLAITGTGGGTGVSSNSYGVQVTGANSKMSATNGAQLTIIGYGGTAITGNSNYGIRVDAEGLISATGTGTVLAVTGTGGGSSTSSSGYGIQVNGTNSKISVAAGANANIKGYGSTTGSGNNNSGIRTDGEGSITADGAGTVLTLTGTGGAMATNTSGYGVLVAETNSKIAATNGAELNVIGIGKANAGGNQNMGVRIENAGSITANGTNTVLTITGTGGGSGNSQNNHGIFVTGTNSKILAANNASVNITGYGGNTGGSGGTNYGIYINTANGLSAASGGALTLRGVKGGQSSSYGVYNNVTGGVTTTGNGAVAVYADTLFLNGANNFNVAGSLTLAPYTNISMGVGTSAGGTFNLSDTYLGYLTAGTYVFGAVMTGNGTTSTTDLTVNTGRDFGTSNLTFVSGRDISLDETLTKSTGAGTANYVFQAKGAIRNAASAGISAGTGSIALTFDSNTDNSGNEGITLNGGVFATGAGAINISDALTLGGDTVFTTTGTQAFGGTVNGGHAFTGSAASFSFNGAWGALTPLGAVSLTSTNALTPPSITASSILLHTTGATSDITLAPGVGLTASDAGNAMVLASSRNFINTASSTALSTANGRWLVYSADPAANTRGGLMPDASDFNKTYAGNAPASIGAGNRFVYSRNSGPTITLDVNDGSVTYGDAYTHTAGYSYVSGLIGGDVWGSIGLSGTPGYSTSYVAGTTNASPTAYANMITGSAGSLASKLGYQFTFTGGDLTVIARATPPALPVSAAPVEVLLPDTVNRVSQMSMPENRMIGENIIHPVFSTRQVLVADPSPQEDENVQTGADSDRQNEIDTQSDALPDLLQISPSLSRQLGLHQQAI